MTKIKKKRTGMAHLKQFYSVNLVLDLLKDLIDSIAIKFKFKLKKSIASSLDCKVKSGAELINGI